MTARACPTISTSRLPTIFIASRIELGAGRGYFFSLSAVSFAPPVQRGIEGCPRLRKIALLESINKFSRCIRVFAK